MGGLLVDRVFEPLMAVQFPGSPLLFLFGEGEGSGAAMLFLLLAVTGEATCLIFPAGPAYLGAGKKSPQTLREAGHARTDHMKQTARE